MRFGGPSKLPFSIPDKLSSAQRYNPLNRETRTPANPYANVSCLQLDVWLWRAKMKPKRKNSAKGIVALVNISQTKYQIVRLGRLHLSICAPALCLDRILFSPYLAVVRDTNPFSDFDVQPSDVLNFRQFVRLRSSRTTTLHLVVLRSPRKIWGTHLWTEEEAA